MHDVEPTDAIPRIVWQQTPLVQSAASLHPIFVEPVPQLPPLYATHVSEPPSAPPLLQQYCALVVHVAEPQGTTPGSLATPPSGTGVAPLLLAPASPLEVPPSPLPLLEPVPLLPPLEPVPLLPPLEPPSSPDPPLLEVLPLPLPELDPLLLPCAEPSPLPGELELPLQCVRASGPAANRTAQQARMAWLFRIEGSLSRVPGPAHPAHVAHLAQ
jgi:hypothetical protein